MTDADRRFYKEEADYLFSWAIVGALCAVLASLVSIGMFISGHTRGGIVSGLCSWIMMFIVHRCERRASQYYAMLLKDRK